MNSPVRLLITSLLLTTVLILAGTAFSRAADLQKFPGARLLNNPANDGDSFFVEMGGRTQYVRLYFIDCPETSADTESDAWRVKEQARYFGLADVARITYFGNKAKNFVASKLARPFTVYTAFANAGGRSAKKRVYAFIITSEGDDLAGLLVKEGLARTRGIGRKTPDGIPRDEMIKRLRDMEVSAMLKRIGIWSESNPERIAELRAKQRSEEKELQEIQKRIEGKTVSPEELINVNTATAEELQSIKGIGPVLARRIIAGRPYKTVDDLLKVKGVGHKTLRDIRPYVTVGKQ